MREIKFRAWYEAANQMLCQKDIRLEFDGNEIFRIFDVDANGQRADQIASDKHCKLTKSAYDKTQIYTHGRHLLRH